MTMYDQPVNPPEQDDFCLSCGTHIGHGKMCRECLLDQSKLDHSETE